jgi:hypothetical protein
MKLFLELTNMHKLLKFIRVFFSSSFFYLLTCAVKRHIYYNSKWVHG